MSYFLKMGLVGWDSIEPIILGAFLSRKAVLLKGLHGCGKTEGVAIISASLLGAGAKFVSYDTSLVGADDLLGFLKPQALNEGRVEYVSTPDSIWDTNSTLLDELNRCNPYNAAKFMELVRSRSINGRPTNLQMVFAAVNPPDRYNTAYMDGAQVSRFVVLEVPSLKSLGKIEQRRLMSTDLQPVDLTTLISNAKTYKRPKGQEKAILDLATKVAETANAINNVNFSGRQLRDLVNLLLAMDSVAATFPDLPRVTEEILTKAIIGLIPETTGLIRSDVKVAAVQGQIATLVQGFKLSDPILTASTLVELAKVSAPDRAGWAGAFVKMLEAEETKGTIENAWSVISNRNDIPQELSNSMKKACAARMARLSINDNATLMEAKAELEKAISSFGGGSQEQTSKARAKKSKS